MPENTFMASDNHWKVRMLERVQPGGIVGTQSQPQPEAVPFGLERDEEQASREDHSESK